MDSGKRPGVTRIINRRSILRGGAIGFIGSIAGCFELSDESEERTDDPPEPETPESATHTNRDELSDEARQRSIEVDTTPFQDPAVGFTRPLSHATAYSYETIEVLLQADSPEFGTLQADTEYVVEALAYEYTTDDVLGSGESEAFTPDAVNGQKRVSVDITFYEEATHSRLTYLLFFRPEIFPSYRTTDSVLPAAVLMATNPFEVTEEGITPAPSGHERESETIDYADLTTENNHPSSGSYTRLNVEGGYHVYFSPSTPANFPDVATEIPFYIPKLIYDTWKEGDRPQRPEPPAERTAYVTESFERGIARHFAEVVEISALLHGARTDRERMAFMSTFIQSLPYALDHISTGYRDYSRYPAETLVDARGDCVDTSILLCAALFGSSVDCEVGFFSFDPDATDGPAGHLAVAVSPDNVSLTGPTYRHNEREFYYIEPTGFFPIGDVPSGIVFEQAVFHFITRPDTE